MMTATDDKAVEAALEAHNYVEGSSWGDLSKKPWKIHPADGSWAVVAEFANRAERDHALKRMNMRAAIAAADKVRAEGFDFAHEAAIKGLPPYVSISLESAFAAGLARGEAERAALREALKKARIIIQFEADARKGAAFPDYEAAPLRCLEFIDAALAQRDGT